MLRNILPRTNPNWHQFQHDYRRQLYNRAPSDENRKHIFFHIGSMPPFHPAHIHCAAECCPVPDRQSEEATNLPSTDYHTYAKRCLTSCHNIWKLIWKMNRSFSFLTETVPSKKLTMSTWPLLQINFFTYTMPSSKTPLAMRSCLSLTDWVTVLHPFFAGILRQPFCHALFSFLLHLQIFSSSSILRIDFLFVGFL